MTLGQGNVRVRVSVDETRDFPAVYGLSYGQRSSGELVEQHIDGLDVFDLLDLRATIDRVIWAG